MYHDAIPRTRLAIALALAAPFAASVAQAPASGAAQPTVKIDAPTRVAVVDTLADRLRRHYVDADTGRLIADRMRARLAAGAYDTVTSAARFAEMLTTDLRSVNGDRHLNVTYNPESPGLRPGPNGIRMGPGRPPAGAPTAPVGPPPDPIRRSNFSLGRIDILPGNVGYLDIRGFSGALGVEQAIVTALTYLQGTDAIIFDLRLNGGGSPYSVNLIISHFTTSDTVASLTVKNRSGNETFTRYTFASVSGPRRPAVPLYVLTSGFTASAGEDFTFVFQNMKRATIVGGTTAGAGHNNANLDIGLGFNASVSFTRVTDPKTGAEWERVGVKPDVPTEPAKALDVAHALALKTIAANTTDARYRRVLDLTRETVEAQASARTIPPSTLAAYAGEYEGGRMVTSEQGRLMYAARAGALAETLVPLNDTTFALGAIRLSFEPAGQGRFRLRIARAEGEPLAYARVR